MKKMNPDFSDMLKELDIDLTPEILEVVEVSPELPSGGTSHCSGTSVCP